MFRGNCQFTATVEHGLFLFNINMANRKTTDQFIGESKNVHGDKYDYTKTEYKLNNKKVYIICPNHGLFKQQPMHHLAGHGCIKCGNKSSSKMRMVGKEEFIKRAINMHGNKYGYDKVDYKGWNSKVYIYCKKHNEYFKQTPHNHQRGAGCPECRNTLCGWTKRKWFKSAKESIYFDSFKIYIIKMVDKNGFEFFKIGRTYTTIKRRFRDMEFKYDIIKTFSVSGCKKSYSDSIFNLEILLHKMNIKYTYDPIISFDGQKECYSNIKNLDIESIYNDINTQ